MLVCSPGVDLLDHIYSPHREMPRNYLHMQGWWWDMNFIYVYLAFVEVLDMHDTFFLHGWLVISCHHDLFSHHMPIFMASICSFIHFLKDLFSFTSIYVSQQHLIFPFFIQIFTIQKKPIDILLRVFLSFSEICLGYCLFLMYWRIS